MILGREPIHFLRQSATLLLLTAPQISLGQNKPPHEESDWTTKPPDKIPEGRAEARPSTVEAESSPGEFTDPWSENQTDEVDSSVKPADESPGHSEPWSRNYWDDYDSTSRPAPPQFEERRHRHVRSIVPNYSLWLGVGAGWTLPFGDVWGSCVGFDSFGRCAAVTGVPTHDYVAQGPALELDLGARVARNYNIYGLWEHSWLGAGSATSANRGQPDHAESDFLALGIRVSTDPEQLGFVLDIAVGTRRMRAVWADGTELQMTDAPFETRLGLGADVRLNESWSLSPMLYLGLGSFGKVQWVNPDGTVQAATQPGDVALTHGWVGIQMAAHVDAFGTK
jgi:hypothetical protein